MNLARPAATIAAASIALIALTGCQPESADQGNKEPSPIGAKHGSSIGIKKLIGDKTPDNISIVCVDGSAFLYVYSSGIREGGPSIARSPEQDQICKPGTSSPEPTPKETPR